MTDEDSQSGTGLLDRETTGEDRVRMVARQLSEPRTANWVAAEAGWSHEPTKRVLERLVADGVLHRDDSGPHVTYYPDYRRQAMQEAMRLRDSEYSVEDLTDRLADMNAQIREWKDEFNVESPNQLRGTLAEASLDAEEEDRRREIAREWEHLQRRIRIVGFAVREWDFLAPTTESGEASRYRMAVPHPGGDPNATLYAQLKRDVLDRVPQITTVEYVPDAIEAQQLRAQFDPARLDPPTGSDPPVLTIAWYRQDPRDRFRINYTDPNTGFHAG